MFWMRDFAGDLRQAARFILSNPGFAAASVLTLAVGIGAVSGVYSVFDAVVLRPLPYDEPESLVMLRIGDDGYPGLSGGEIAALQEHARQFEDFGFLIGFTVALTGPDQDGGWREGSGQVPAASISSGLLPLLGVEPLLGRNVASEDRYSEPGGYPSVLISYRLWQSRFGGDSQVVGRLIEVNNRGRTIIGVMPQGFKLWLGPATNIASENDIFVPVRENRFANVHAWRTIGRLRPGATAEQARQEVQSIGERVMRQNPQAYGAEQVQFHVVPLKDDLLGQSRSAIQVLFLTAVFVLLIACVNVAQLQSARGFRRRAETALRTTLGATRSRIVRQVVVENLLLALLGGSAGLTLAWMLLKMPNLGDFPRSAEVAVNAQVGLFTLAASLVSGMLFGFYPALKASRADLHALLKEGGRGPISGTLGRSWSVLQVASALVFVVGSALLLRTLINFQQVDVGFEPRDVLTFRVSLDPQRISTPEARWDYYRGLRRELLGLPSVESVGGIRRLPFQADQWTSFWSLREGVQAAGDLKAASYDWVLPGYFETMGIVLQRGRLFQDSDMTRDLLAVVIDEDLARRAWPGEDAVGMRLRVEARFGSSERTWADVIGVVRHVRAAQVQQRGLPQIYFPLSNMVSRSGAMNMVVRAPGGLSLASALRGLIKKMGGGRPLHSLQAMTRYVEDATAPTRSASLLVGALALAALLLSAVGVYGTASQSIGRRGREIGVRMAVGATRPGIFAMVAGDAVKLLALALPLGLVGSFWFAHWIEHWLFQVAPTDPLTWAGGCLLVSGAVFLACLDPALLAARTDPLTVLNRE